MKKTILLGLAVMTLCLAATSCNKAKEEKQVVETQEVVGDVVEMPANPDDTTVVAAGEAIAVQEAVPAQ